MSLLTGIDAVVFDVDGTGGAPPSPPPPPPPFPKT